MAKAKSKKPMTIDELARMMARGLENVATKTGLATLETKIDKRFSHVEFRLEELRDTLERVLDNDISNLQKRVYITSLPRGLPRGTLKEGQETLGFLIEWTHGPRPHTPQRL